MNKFNEITDQIKILKDARGILQQRYEASEFHKKKEKYAQSPVPPSPKDEEILKLLATIHQIDVIIKELQEEQFRLLKAEES